VFTRFLVYTVLCSGLKSSNSVHQRCSGRISNHHVRNAQGYTGQKVSKDPDDRSFHDDFALDTYRSSFH
jgi:hypothetical protein